MLDKEGLLKRAAKAAEEHPEFVAFWLSLFSRCQEHTYKEIWEYLEIDEERYTRLMLCTLPRVDRFEEDITEMATHFPANRDRLREVIISVLPRTLLPTDVI